MLVLAIDSAASSCAAAVWQDGQTLAEAREVMERGQDRRLIPLILDVMQQANLAFGQLDRIGVTRGPGSFTGLRIGLAAARGLGLAAAKPVIGIDRFAIYRQPLRPDNDALVVIQSKRAELFCRFYPRNNAPKAPQMLLPETIRTEIVNRPGLQLAGDVSEFSSPPTPISDATICAMLTAASSLEDPDCAPRPLYMRSPDVTVTAAKT